ncbi:putative RNA-directed DNA polymerase [Rosa chinensis]|uniref:Putative RNA-directed DNA polymerase n=1 Tax=Rosa chinensis TaxID=74649 RepID=A0A2P6S433_ROSCH|nr:putative RNA-directed DNA polymerase [Rosa chinensis]
MFPSPNIPIVEDCNPSINPAVPVQEAPALPIVEDCNPSINPAVPVQEVPAVLSDPEIDMQSVDEPTSPSAVVLRRNPPRERGPPSKLNDYVTYNARYPMTHFISYNKFSSAHSAFLSALDNTHEPQSFEEANHLAEWKQAMTDELQALNDNNTWSIVRIPKGKKAVGCRWVYKTKFHTDGTVERHKARLVARGFTQTYGVDYKETFAPVAKMNTVRVLLSVAINHAWPLYQMDVKNAFLHGDLEEEVYMRLPPGHSQSHDPDIVCKLHKAIYGLKQSPRAWYAKLSSVLEEVGFHRSNADSSLFIRIGSTSKLLVLIYVDDLIITGDNAEEIELLKQSLRNRFAIKDLGILKYFLGIEMATSHKGLFLNQRKYVLDLLQDADMKDCKPARTPLDSKLQLDVSSKSPCNLAAYQRLVGKLIYLTITRPDIAYAVSIVSQFMHAPTLAHLHIVKRILRYLKGSVGRGILMKNNGDTHIMGYTDADWAGNSLDRKSTTGFCTFVGGNLVTWKSKKQTVVARSSAEAEYRAMASTACELIWLKGLLSDLGFPTSQPMSLFCDNQAAMHIASNPVFHERTKHIEVDCHYIRAQVQSKIIDTHYTRSHDQLADIFTKSLSTAQFHRILGKLGSMNPLDPA